MAENQNQNQGDQGAAGQQGQQGAENQQGQAGGQSQDRPYDPVAAANAMHREFKRGNTDAVEQTIDIFESLSGVKVTRETAPDGTGGQGGGDQGNQSGKDGDGQQGAQTPTGGGYNAEVEIAKRDVVMDFEHLSREDMALLTADSPAGIKSQAAILNERYAKMKPSGDSQDGDQVNSGDQGKGTAQDQQGGQKKTDQADQGGGKSHEQLNDYTDSGAIPDQVVASAAVDDMIANRDQSLPEGVNKLLDGGFGPG
jgi:hypothetical protein